MANLEQGFKLAAVIFDLDCLVETENPTLARSGLLDLLAQLSQPNTPVAVILKSSQSKNILVQAGLDHFFSETIILSEEDESNATPTNVVLEAAERIKVDPSRQLVFTESVLVTKAAKEAGSLVVGMPNRSYDFQTRADLIIAGAISYFPSWGNINLDVLTEGLNSFRQYHPSPK